MKPPALAYNMAVFLDFDGTLVDLADRPDLVSVPALVKQRLVETSAALNGALAVVSGRRIADIDKLLGTGLVAVAGLHGWERRAASGETHYAAPVPACLAEARSMCAAFAAATDGIIFEDKGAGFALHFRLRPAAAEACWHVAHAAEKICSELEAHGGHSVVELRPAHAGKGKAVAAYLKEPPFIGRWPVFIGDDATDEDAFAAVAQQGGVGILVGPKRETNATAYLPTVADVRNWLGELERTGTMRIAIND